jgi:lysophospholipase L1-like esterase
MRMEMKSFCRSLIRPLAFSGLLAAGLSAAHAQDLKYSFQGSAPGFTPVTPQSNYDATAGFGYLTPPDGLKPSIFAVDVPEGNYDVTITFGDPASAADTTIKAESRRLMIEKVDTLPGKTETRTFTVNERRPEISTGGAVAIDSREKGPPVVPDWDTHLSFEFNGSHPGVQTLEVKPDPTAVTIFLAGDSTVTDQTFEPWCTWGQMLPRFFGPGVAIADYAQSGLTATTFEHQRRLAKLLSVMKKGDYLFIQFGHNDQKDKAPGSGPYTTYKANLKRYVEAARGKGGIPVIVTPMERRRWLGDQPQPTLADFAAAGRQVASEEGTPLIDLNAMSLKFYAALGPDKSTKAFVHYPANTYPGQVKELKDDTHHNPYGGYELARCVVEGIKSAIPALAPYLTPTPGPFDPSKPDSPDTFSIPASPFSVVQKPAGS